MHDERTLERLGFMRHRGGTHTSRTIMLAELSTLMDVVPPYSPRAAYINAIRDQNCLSKRSGRTRDLTARHLSALYSLDPANPIFAGFRLFWEREPAAQPQLALLTAMARDNILSEIAPLILKVGHGNPVARVDVEQLISERWPERFSAATLKSTAQNVNSSLTQSGHLSGRAKKTRQRIEPGVASTAYAFYLAWLSGARGEFLLDSRFCQLLDNPTDRLLELGGKASARGWMLLRRVDSVIDIDFPELASVIRAASEHREPGEGTS